MIYEIENLEDARNFLSFTEDKVILTTTPGSIKYYGMLAVDYMLKTLNKEFSNKIEDVTVNIGDDHAALFTAVKLNYKNIIYTGDSEEAKGLLGRFKK
ncbi:MAG: hypothetical protein ACIPMY_04470 [Rickettsia endosymbiont of Pentastiridius leporinus]